MNRLIISLFLMPIWVAMSGQSNFVYIDTISIEGNKRTRDEIILRELKFKKGDFVSVDELNTVIKESENLVLNTSLFNKVEIYFKDWIGENNHVHIQIKVAETLYIYPVPIFELADRNFNVWWVEQKRSLQRTNFGMEFAHLNFTGRKDRFKVNVKYGYTRKYSLGYRLPFINKAQTLGASIDVSYAQNREMNYVTIDNRQEFFQNEKKFVYQRFKAETGFTYRPGLLMRHQFILQYQQNRIDDMVAQELNPNFFIAGRSLQRFFAFNYIFTYNNLDYNPYPTSGNYFRASIDKDGLGAFNDRNGLTLSAEYFQYLKLAPKWSVGLRTKGKVSLVRNRQPYNDNRAIGFGRDYLRGYEYYIVDGLDMAYLKTAFRFRLWENEIKFGKIIPIKAFRNMPVKLFLSMNNDFGYANDPFEKELNFLNNRLLWGGGFGLDIVLFYDKVFQVEYSFNHLFENGLFLHLNLNI